MSRPIGLAGFERKFEDGRSLAMPRSAFELLKRRRALAGHPSWAPPSTWPVAMAPARGRLPSTHSAPTRLMVRRRRSPPPGGCSGPTPASASTTHRRPVAAARTVAAHSRLRARLLSRAPSRSAACSALVARLAPGGELIAVHHVVAFDDAWTPPAHAAALLRVALARQLKCASRRSYGRYEVVRWRCSRGSTRA